LVWLDLRIKYRRLRLLGKRALSRFTVNARPGKAGGPRSDPVEISAGREKQFDIRAHYD